MGIVLWLACGGAALVLARIIPLGRRRGWIAEGLTALVVAFACGVGATALDFGGWQELDWRAGVFAFLGAFAAVGIIRAARSGNRRSPAAPADAVPRDPHRADA